VNTQSAAATISPSRILVRGVNWLGDAVMSTPALLRLRERFPGARISLLTHEKLRDLWPGHPAANDVIAFGENDSVLAVARKLRPGQFDLALVLPNSPRSAMEIWLAGIPQRIGYARPWRSFFLTQSAAARPDAVEMHKRSVGEIRQIIARTDAGSTISTPKTEFSEQAHHVHQYLHLTAALGANPQPLAPRLEIANEEIEAARQKFALAAVTDAGRPLLGLNPNAEYGAAKRWPVERFIAVATRVQRQTNCVWLLLGGKTDAAVTAQIAVALNNSSGGVRDLAGRTSLRELMALLKSCRLLLTNDTGPMHVAAALGTTVVVPFGSTSPELTGPGWLNDARHRLIKSDAPCSPCFLRECPIDFRCMNGISADRVTEAVLSALR
jgi:heptosyltransferase-2